MKELWSDCKISITCFMTDDSKALKSALKMIWPEVIQLICQFHVMSAVWNWLFVLSNNVPKADRKICINSVRYVMYAASDEEAARIFMKSVFLIFIAWRNSAST
jgi:MULE transposase domain